LKKVYIASDHAGFTLKEQIKKKFANKIDIIDLGTDNSTTSVNYPNYAHQLCKKVSLDNKNIGILVCGSGMGMSMAANRHKKNKSCFMLFSIKYKIIKIA
jgi:ribose 5-phosphate isomerase B